MEISMEMAKEQFRKCLESQNKNVCEFFFFFNFTQNSYDPKIVS